VYRRILRREKMMFSRLSISLPFQVLARPTHAFSPARDARCRNTEPLTGIVERKRRTDTELRMDTQSV